MYKIFEQGLAHSVYYCKYFCHSAEPACLIKMFCGDKIYIPYKCFYLILIFLRVAD